MRRRLFAIYDGVNAFETVESFDNAVIRKSVEGQDTTLPSTIVAKREKSIICNCFNALQHFQSV